MIRIAVTGASGFVGTALVEALTRRGYSVRAGTRAPMPCRPNVEYFPYGDLANEIDWTTFVTGAQRVIHLAGIAHTEGVARRLYDQINTRQTAALAASAKAAGVERLIFISSVRAQVGPFATEVIREHRPAMPTDDYGRSKLAAERAIADSKVPFVILRPVLIYGPGVKGNLAALSRVARSRVPLPFGSLTSRRSLCSLEKLIDAIDLSLTHERALGGTYLVADSAPVTLGEIVQALASGRRGPVQLRVAPWILKLGLTLVGRRDMWDRLGGQLIVDSSRLAALGWKPAETVAGLEHIRDSL
ncbi:MAG: NAD-dependent epimerase/dehydratase family protein [Kofleriaceae bacterium]